MQDADTPQGETVAPVTDGTVAQPDTGSTVQEPQTPADEVISRAEYERVLKERQKAEMRARQLENKQEQDRLKQLEEKEEFKTLYEESQNKLREIEEQKAREESLREAREFRDKVISEYPDETTRKAAQALIAKNESNLTWGDVESFDQAKTELIAQLDALKETVAPGESTPTGPSPQVHPNNPIPQTDGKVSQDDLYAEAVRTKDWSKVLRQVPSINAMASTFDEE